MNGFCGHKLPKEDDSPIQSQTNENKYSLLHIEAVFTRLLFDA